MYYKHECTNLIVVWDLDAVFVGGGYLHAGKHVTAHTL